MTTRVKVMKPLTLRLLTAEQSQRFPLTSNLLRLYRFPYSGKTLQQVAIVDASRINRTDPIPSITE